MVILLIHNHHAESFIFCQVGPRLPWRYPLSFSSWRVIFEVVNFLPLVIAQRVDGYCAQPRLSFRNVERAGFPWSTFNPKPYLDRQRAWKITFLFTVQHIRWGRVYIRARITHVQGSWLLSNTWTNLEVPHVLVHWHLCMGGCRLLLSYFSHLERYRT